MGRRVETPAGAGLVTGYAVLEDTCTVVLDGEEAPTPIPVDDCRELAGERRDKKR